MQHPCIGDTCGRRDGIACGPDLCDLDAGIYEPAEGELTAAEMACVRAARERQWAETEGRPADRGLSTATSPRGLPAAPSLLGSRPASPS